jgi:hypothetical protein
MFSETNVDADSRDALVKLADNEGVILKYSNGSSM